MKSIIGLDINDSTYDFSKAFVTLAAPSMEGKTQFAFVLEKIRPLYFALDRDRYERSDDKRIGQPICANFDGLNHLLDCTSYQDYTFLQRGSCEELDKHIRELISKRELDRDSGIFVRLSSYALKTYRTNIKFSTLGLFFQLVKDARNNYDNLDVNNRPVWLKYHANRKKIYYVPKSIDEIPSNFFDGYCLFLDEYKKDFQSYFIRNLAEAVGLRCIISNTNTYVESFKELREMALNISKEKSIWSIVVTELKMGSYLTLNSLTNIEENINWICENAISDEYKDDKKIFREFFNDFKEKQILELRPGVAMAVANLINKFKNEHQTKKTTVEEFLSYIVNELCKMFLIENFTKGSFFSGKAADISLLFEQAYDRSNRSNSLSNTAEFLNCRLFYMANLANPKKWVFLTLPSQESSSYLDFLDERYMKPIRLPWELTYFKPGEIFTLLPCLNMLFMDYSFTESVEYAMTVIADSLFFYKNYKEVLLENLSIICFSHSSHRAPRDEWNSLTGQSGTNYLINFFINALPKLKTSRSKIFAELKFPDVSSQFNIQEFLDRVAVPFLYVTHAEIPEVFKAIQSGSAIEDRSINLGTIGVEYEKPHFEIKFTYNYRSADKVVGSYTCKADRKNWVNTLAYKDLLKMLAYAKNSNETLCIIVCQNLRKAHSEAVRKLNQYCEENKINAYKIRLSEKIESEEMENRTYNVIQMSEEVSEDPSMVILVLELSEKGEIVEDAVENEKGYDDGEEEEEE